MTGHKILKSEIWPCWGRTSASAPWKAKGLPEVREPLAWRLDAVILDAKCSSDFSSRWARSVQQALEQAAQCSIATTKWRPKTPNRGVRFGYSKSRKGRYHRIILWQRGTVY